MKRLFLFYLYFTLCMVATQANPVTQTQALQKAKAFLLTKGLEVNAEMNMVYQGRKTSHQHEALAKNAYYYVFNNGSNGGFVIVAGDDCAEEVLGYIYH